MLQQTLPVCGFIHFIVTDSQQNNYVNCSVGPSLWLWSNMPESVFAIVSHTVPVEIMCDTECTSTVIFSVFGTSYFPHVLIMCGKCDAHADGQMLL